MENMRGETGPINERRDYRYDALVIGGGPAGASAAALLAQAGWSTALVEESVFPRRKVCGEFVSASNLPLLRALGVSEEYVRLAGPSVERVGLFTGAACLSAPMPGPPGSAQPFGRALGRDQLDSLLLNRARDLGARIFQPYRATEIARVETGYQCLIQSAAGDEEQRIIAGVIIAAHGSWKRGTLATQSVRPTARNSDLFGFKALFSGDRLTPGLMPLLAFPGGYGGMALTDGGRLSFSCCIRRDRLATVRALHPEMSAGQATFEHILDSCKGVRDALSPARLEDRWLAIGPLQPGIRVRPMGGIFLVGNAAGEAHPAIAEGISIALQSAWILSRLLIDHRDEILIAGRTDAVAREYTRLWRKRFTARIRVSAIVASFAMRAPHNRWLLPIIRRVPQILTYGARWSGKALDWTDGGRMTEDRGRLKDEG